MKLNSRLFTSWQFLAINVETLKICQYIRYDPVFVTTSEFVGRQLFIILPPLHLCPPILCII